VDNGAVSQAVGGAGHNIGAGIDRERANGGAAPEYTRFRDERGGEVGVGRGEIGGRVTQEPS